MTRKIIQDITDRIAERSQASREAYIEKLNAMRTAGRPRGQLACGNLAHVLAACSEGDKKSLSGESVPNIAIVSAYNDMLSAHQPYHAMLGEVKNSISAAGGVSQMAGGVPAMCDGVTQGQPGMELSLFSREVVAMATAIALSHNVFDGAVLMGVCDKIVPGLLMGALSFGHLPILFIPSGPMPTGISNSQKAMVRQQFAAGEIGRDELLQSEIMAYHSPGTCTFYGTANTNQMMLELLGLQLPGSSFINPGTPLRYAVTDAGAQCIVNLAAQEKPIGLGEMVTTASLVNAIIGLLATGGSTNHTLHIPAIAAAAGIKITWQDFADLSAIVPLITRVYPNGTADVNQFQNAGGVPYVVSALRKAGLLNEDVLTIMGGTGLAAYTTAPKMVGDSLEWKPAPDVAGDDMILRPVDRPFQSTGGLALLKGEIGSAIMKISAVKPEHHRVRAPAIVFDSQDGLLEAYKAGELERDFIAVIRFQGPKANGMPELHKLTPSLGVLQDKGHKVALVTDGRMSGASGKVPAAIHVTPEALAGGVLARIVTGDMITLDANKGILSLEVDPKTLDARVNATPPCTLLTIGRDLFTPFRDQVGMATEGATIFKL